MPEQNLPVLGDGAHLTEIGENIALGPAHTFCAVTSSLHMGAAAGTASLHTHSALLCPPVQGTHRWVDHPLPMNAAVRAAKRLKACSSY